MQFDKQTALQELGIPEDMYDELIRLFIEQTEPELKKLDEIVKVADFAEIAKSAHFIKGSAGNLRLEKIRALAENINVQAKEDKDIKTIEKNLAELKVNFEELKGIALKNKGGINNKGG